jgi:hypothetical protein
MYQSSQQNTQSASQQCVMNGIGATMHHQFAGGEPMAWDGDDLAGQAEEVFERQQAAADARAHRGASTVEERARSAKFETLRLSRSRIMGQLSRATNPAHRTMLERALKSINDQMGE